MGNPYLMRSSTILSTYSPLFLNRSFKQFNDEHLKSDESLRNIVHVLNKALATSRASGLKSRIQ